MSALKAKYFRLQTFGFELVHIIRPSLNFVKFKFAHMKFSLDKVDYKTTEELLYKAIHHNHQFV